MIKQKHCGFPEIGQYRNVVRTVQDRARYVGRDENGDPLFDHSRKAPTLSFLGTVKLHGTNGGVTFTRDGQWWVQSREQILTREKDNAGFCKFVEENIESFQEILKTIPFGDMNYITLFGEWCGRGIQKGVAISELPRMFVIFDVKFSYEDETVHQNFYGDTELLKTLKSPSSGIYNIYDFPTYEITVDFENPGMFQNRLIEMVEEVEKECPVGKHFNVEGVGEGIVFRYQDGEGNVYRWKSKGEKHSSSKVKTLVPIDVEKLESVQEFVNYSVTESRLEQSLEKTFGIGGEPVMERMGDFIRWIVQDIQKEELDVLTENNLTPKDVNSEISKRCRNWLIEKINSSF